MMRACQRPQLPIKCIVIDLDQTLIATQEDVSSLKQMGILYKPELMSLRNRTYYIEIEDLEGPGSRYHL